MFLAQLYLSNFRCFSARSFEFFKDTTSIFGLNGAGKSSLLEAIMYISYSSSYRTNLKTDLIKHDAREAFIKAIFKDQDDKGQEVLQKQLCVGFNAEKKVIKINDTAAKTHKEISNIIKPVLLQHKDIDIVAGYPEMSRNFLQQLSSAYQHETSRHYYHLKNILKQRKKLLENTTVSITEIRLWTEKLHTLSTELRKNNINLVKNLDLEVKKLSKNFALELNYKINNTLELTAFGVFWEVYSKEILPKELNLKKNLIGAHYDYLETTYEKKNAKKFASRGQQRMLVFFLKIAAAQILQAQNPDSVVILLVDDFFSELDPENKNTSEMLLQELTFQKIITYPFLPKTPQKNSLLI